MVDQDKKLVYSSDPEENSQIQSTKKAPQELPTSKFTAIFRLEKNQRGGKTVTVVHGFPKNEEYLKNLTKELKTKCGVGGTYKTSEGSLEIQGDQRDKLKRIFDTKGIKYKGM